MKIALIGTRASTVVGFRAEMIGSLVSRGHTVYAFAVDYDDKVRSEAKAMGVMPVDYSLDRTGINPFSDVVNTLKLAIKLKRIRPDMTFTYFSKPVVFGTLAAFLAGVRRRVGMLEGLGYIFTDEPGGVSTKVRFLKRIQVFLYRITFPLLERIIFLNQDDAHDLLCRYKINVKTVTVLGGIGLNLARYPYVPPNTEEVSFLFVGRLLMAKGIHDFISAAKIVAEQKPHAKFVVLGRAAERHRGGFSADEVKSLIADTPIEYCGYVSDVAERIANCSVFVLPSYYREGVPRSTQEAMAVGRPVITTDVPGCRETVIDGVNGFLVPPWSPEALARKMLYFIDNPDQIKTMGEKSFEMAKDKFDVRKVNQRLLEVLDI